ncbi:creatininase family protein [Metallosphaera hakonensis JCM 8857 = DSM 7519]|uniref:Creatininase n=2 Tax=Metallosphaera hakonensis TaxID=79601 RepID=A0A2U9IXH3_9CREN|nr:creatininase family protein [Metallosphaera hakonensis JCM 8857 = DSM 7519]
MHLQGFTKDDPINPVGALPVGSLEQHGPHLPLGTDSIIAEEIAREVSRIEGLTLLPTVHYGCSFEHGSLPHISVKDTHFMDFIEDIISSTPRIGMKGVVIINGHGGNSHLLTAVARRVNFTVGRPRVIVVNLPSAPIFKEYGDLHAGNVETSIMMYLRPDLIRLDKIPKVTKFSSFTFNILTSEMGGDDGVVSSCEMKPDTNLGKRAFQEMVELALGAVRDLKTIINSS